MKCLVNISITIAVILSCGCMMMADEATGEWEKESFSTPEKMTIKPDGTFTITDINRGGIKNGTWRKLGETYEFASENSENKEYATISRGRAQLFMNFESATYVKI